MIPKGQTIMGDQLRVEAMMPVMTRRDESRKEVSPPTQSLATPRKIIRVGAWNVRTMYESGKTAQVIKEMDRYKVNILGISEMRWTDSGIVTLGSGQTVVYSGRSDGQHQEGVGLIIDKQTRKSLLSWEPIDARIIRARFYSTYAKITVIQCYAPTEQAKEEEKDIFYHNLQSQIDKSPRHDIMIIMGDINAKIGSDNNGYETCMGKEAMGERNNNGQRLIDLCLENGLVIGGSVFQHKTIHKTTWNSPDNKTKNQIDHIAINQKWRRSMKDVKAIRGADVGSDHNLVLCKLQLKLKKVDKKPSLRLFDSSKLKDAAVKSSFVLELSNRFGLLENLPEDDINTHCNKILNLYTESSKTTLGHKTIQKKEWISEATWSLVERRKEAKQKMLASNGEINAEARHDYKIFNTGVKRSARKDKRDYIENMALEAQVAADKGDSQTVYRVIKSLTGGLRSKSTTVKDKNGNNLSTEKDQLQRWAEHFEDILNRPDPEIEADITNMGFQIEMAKGPILEQEIAEAIKRTKGNKAPGEDRVTADMLKADPAVSARTLVGLFNKVWEEEQVPASWKRGIIVKVPKKGDLTICENWRGINLLSATGKIFCRILLMRMRTGIERVLREEQAGFRAERSCNDQIFVLRSIVEQSLEWNSSLYINYIDFEKAFDSIHHPTLWKILESYGLPEKVINILKDIYTGNQCCVRHENQQSEWFQVKTGVRQGCVISPVIFLIVIDWVMRRATADKPRGIVWGLTSFLEDCDFADDIALLSHSQKDLQEKTIRVEKIAKSVGLKINSGKTKLMKVKTKSSQKTHANGVEIEEIENFKYLGSYISANGCIDMEISTRIAMAAQAFNKLGKIWKSSSLQYKTKLKLYKSNVRSVLLYAAETWKTNTKIESRLRGFEGRCLRRILHINWEDHISNIEVRSRTGLNCITDEIKKRRWRWLGHVLRMDRKRLPSIALKWTPSGKRNRGRPLGTWRRTIDEEARAIHKTWHEISWLAQDREAWRSFVAALCSTGSDKE